MTTKAPFSPSTVTRSYGNLIPNFFLSLFLTSSAVGFCFFVSPGFAFCAVPVGAAAHDPSRLHAHLHSCRLLRDLAPVLVGMSSFDADAHGRRRDAGECAQVRIFSGYNAQRVCAARGPSDGESESSGWVTCAEALSTGP